MDNDPGIFIGKGDRPVYLLPRLANRHGLIAGATGTGKTVSLQILAEDFSRRGVPVFLSDVKGDLSRSLPGSLLGSVREEGSPAACHGVGNGAAVAGTYAGSE